MIKMVALCSEAIWDRTFSLHKVNPWQGASVLTLPLAGISKQASTKQQ